MTNIHKFFFWSIATLFSFVFAAQVEAYTVEVVVKTGSETINALEANIRIPLEVNIESIYNGDSAILFWIETPHYDPESRTISFSGITPGGFRGVRSILSFSVDISPDDLSQFVFSDVRALKNDGTGASTPVELTLNLREIAEDHLPPEPFSITISSTPELFDGQKFLSFATQDKGTGIKKYEHASSWIFSPSEHDWVEGVPPLPVSTIVSLKRIYVRAIDNSGNYQLSSIAGPYHYASLLFGIIIVLCTFLYLRRRFSLQ